MNMNNLREQIRQEANLMERFSAAYRRKMGRMIDAMNGHTPGISTAQCLRLCVETLDMVLASQNQMARVLDQMSGDDEYKPVLRLRAAA